MARRGSLAALLEPGAHWKHAIVATAARLDVFTLLAGGPQTAEAVAAAYRGHPRAFAVFLDALTGLRLLTKRDGRYRNSPFARRHLVRGGPDYRGDQLAVDAICWDLWGRLEEALATGRSPGPGPLFQCRPEAARRLTLGLHHDALTIAPRVAGAVPLEGCRRLLDLGGGAGAYAIAFCERYPELEATLFDLPTVIEVARPIIGGSGVAARIRIVAGDFRRDPLPGPFDAVFMSNILHAGAEADNERLFHRVAGTLRPGGLAIVRDVIMNESHTAPAFGAVFAVNMLLDTGVGRCYSFGEIAGWLEGAGFGEVQEIEPHALLTARRRGA